jgi:23S rRNA pseudouridine1911/1915/1917 synthase
MILSAASADKGKRLDRYLHEQLPDYSRSRLQSWVKDGQVLVDGETKIPAYLLRGVETIVVEEAPLVPLRAEPEDIPLKILYEDADVVAIDKPAGMVVHAGAGCRSGTLVNALLYHFQSLSQVGGDLRPGIVHRLDRYTSGVLLVAKNDRAHQALAAQFAARKIQKIYLALVHGALKQDRGKVERPISRDPVRRIRMTARLAEGREAHTEYRVLKRFPRFTFLEVRIGTGRTHQIRVHLASIFHPVVGDRLYGAPAKVPDQPPLDRFFLHAHRITFAQPTSAEPVTLESPLPPELQSWMDGLQPLE